MAPGLADHPLFEHTRAGQQQRRRVFAWHARALAGLLQAGFHTPAAAESLARARDHALREALRRLDQASEPCSSL
jgi:hypothetical protein